MYTFFRKNQKFVMVVMVILMIAFIIPTFFDRGGGQRNFEVGQVGDQKVLKGQIDQAAFEWEYLLNTAFLPQTDQYQRQQFVPVVAILAHPQPGEEFPQAVDRLFREMRDNPEYYYLLQLEARKMGLNPSLDENDEQGIVVKLPDSRRVPLQDSNDEMLNNRVRSYLANLLMVQRAFIRAAQTAKISQPMISFELANAMQQIKCYVVDFPLSSYQEKVPEPTDEQLKQHFEAFADFLPNSQPTEANPFGFGYKYPNRVKLQYVGVPRAEVARIVRASKPDPYDWSVEAYKYYDKHQSEFPTTQPATTSPADALTLGPVVAPTSGPATRPFEEVREQIISQLVEAQVDRLQPQIVSEIRNRLMRDYEAYRNANPAPTTATTAPTTGFASFEYLQELAREIEARHKITITVATISDSFKSAAELRLLPGIGQVIGYADMATVLAEPFVPQDQRNRPEVLSLYEPSRPMPDALGNTYLWRITDADPSHRPALVEEVREQAIYDWKRAQAMALAKDDAQKLLEQAKSTGLKEAAEQAGLKLAMTGFYSPYSREPIDNYSVSSRAQTTFVNKTYALMSALADKTTSTRPVGLVELPADGKVAVAELIAIESRMSPDTSDLTRSFLTQRMTQEYRQAIGMEWFNLESVIQRLGYEDFTGKHRPKAAQAAAR
jgi:hypothetical protein